MTSGPFAPTAPQPRYELMTRKQLLAKREEFEQELVMQNESIDFLYSMGKYDEAANLRKRHMATIDRISLINELLNE